MFHLLFYEVIDLFVKPTFSLYFRICYAKMHCTLMLVYAYILRKNASDFTVTAGERLSSVFVSGV